MNSYCLNQDELSEFLHGVLYDDDYSIQGLSSLVESANDWDIMLCGLSYFLGRILQKKINNNNLELDFIDKVYELENSIYFDLNSLNIEFIDFIILHDRFIEPNSSLNEVLVFLHDKYIKRNYEQIVRY